MRIFSTPIIDKNKDITHKCKMSYVPVGVDETRVLRKPAGELPCRNKGEGF